MGVPDPMGMPILFVATVLVFFILKVPTKQIKKSNIRRVDYLGCITLVTTLVLFLLGLNSGGNIVPLKSALVFTPYFSHYCFSVFLFTLRGTLL